MPCRMLSRGVPLAIPRLGIVVTQDAPHPDLVADLTEAQVRAVTHPGGPMLVLAGPGSGKTRVITRRIAFLIASGVPAWRILALTFTNKAAGAMRERVDALVGEDVPGRRGLVVGTFHSFCAGLLRRYGPMSAAAGLGVPLDASFSIIDSDDAHTLLKRAIEELGLDRKSFPAAMLSSRISAAKNRLLTADEFAQEAADFQGRSDARIYRAYEAALRRQSALDFDDLLLRAARMLRDDAGVLRKFAGRSSLATYLAVIARRVTVRRLVRDLEGSPAPGGDLSLEPALAPAHLPERIEDRDQVEAMLHRLDDDEARLVRLHHLEGRSYGEISRHTGLPLGSIGPALSRARAKLRSLMEAPQPG